MLTHQRVKLVVRVSNFLLAPACFGQFLGLRIKDYCPSRGKISKVDWQAKSDQNAILLLCQTYLVVTLYITNYSLHAVLFFPTILACWWNSNRFRDNYQIKACWTTHPNSFELNFLDFHDLFPDINWQAQTCRHCCLIRKSLGPPSWNFSGKAFIRRTKNIFLPVNVLTSIRHMDTLPFFSIGSAGIPH